MNPDATPRTRGETFRARLDVYERLIRLDKPIGTLLLLWPTLSALWIASWGYATARLVVIFVMGTLLMRSAGCAFNDWADRGFDAHVKRTAQRPLAAGEIPPVEALAVAAALALCAFVFVLATNTTTILMSLPAVAIAIVYPFTKRFFALPQAFLGLAFSFGIPMAYASVYNMVPPLAWWLLGLNAFWVMAYDTEYAMVDRDDDVRLGLRTSAIAFGRLRRGRGDALLCGLPRRDGVCRHVLECGAVLLRGAHRRARLCAVALLAHPDPRPRALLPGVPAQPLARAGGVRRHCPRLRGAQRRVAAQFLAAVAEERRPVNGTAAAQSGRKRGLPPVLALDTCVLLLGSFPSEASLAARQYYAHPRNHFWPLVGALVGAPLALMPYRKRLSTLRTNRVGLWDAIVACERRGSLDGAIRNAERGDIARVRRAAPAVALVCFNGKTAARAERAWHEAGYATLVLPSSSPAYTLPFATKLAAWSAIADVLRGDG